MALLRLVPLLTACVALHPAVAVAERPEVDHQIVFERRPVGTDSPNIYSKSFTWPRPTGTAYSGGTKEFFPNTDYDDGLEIARPAWFAFGGDPSTRGQEGLAFLHRRDKRDDQAETGDLFDDCSRLRGDRDMAHRWDLNVIDPTSAVKGPLTSGWPDASPPFTKRVTDGEAVEYEGRLYSFNHRGESIVTAVERYPSGCIGRIDYWLSYSSDFDGRIYLGLPTDLRAAQNRYANDLELMTGSYGSNGDTKFVFSTSMELDLNLWTLKNGYRFLNSEGRATGETGSSGTVGQLIPSSTAEIRDPDLSIDSKYLAFAARVYSRNAAKGFSATHGDWEIYIAPVTINADAGSLTLGKAVRQTFDSGSDRYPAFSESYVDLDGVPAEGPDYSGDNVRDDLLVFSHRPNGGDSDSQQTSTTTSPNYDLCLLKPRFVTATSGAPCLEQLTNAGGDDVAADFKPYSLVHSRALSSTLPTASGPAYDAGPHSEEGSGIPVMVRPTELPPPPPPAPTVISNVVENKFGCTKLNSLQRRVKRYSRKIAALRRQAKGASTARFKRLLRSYKKTVKRLSKESNKLVICKIINSLAASRSGR